MNAPVSPAGNGSSTRPYLIRALHEWCTDNGYTPYLAVHVDETVQVPLEYVKNGEIVLNVSFEATSALTLGNDVVSFRARFGGVARDISVPVDRVVAIYARENGQGMAFPVPAPAAPRGSAVAPLQAWYVVIGGALVGIAGAAYTLDLKQGWSYRHTAGIGWIALAIVIFGGWNPWRVALGCYLFGALQTLATRWQGAPPGVLDGIPTQVYQLAPFALMILVLALVNGATNPAVSRSAAGLPAPLRRPALWLLGRLSVEAPAALGQSFVRP